MSGTENDSRPTRRSAYLPTVLLYAFVAVVAVVLPVVALAAGLPRMGQWSSLLTCWRRFALLASLGILGIAYWQVKKLPVKTLRNLLPTVLWVVVSLHLLSLFTQCSIKSWDYGVYEQAAKDVAAGKSPYHFEFFQYPPLMAQVMAGTARATENVAAGLGLDATRLESWDVVYYLYQCMQFILVVLLYWLGYLFARGLGLGKAAGAMVVCALLVFNTPLLDIVRWNQVDLWMVNTILAAVLVVQHRPYLSGIALALGGHIKLSPLIVLGPGALARRWRTVVGAVGAGGAIVLLQTNFGRSWHLWREFLINYGQFTLHRIDPINASVYNLVHTLLHPIGAMSGMDQSTLLTAVSWITGAVNVALLIWFAVRFFQRERAYQQIAQPGAAPSRNNRPLRARLYGHAMDAIALGLLVSPSVWVHHYILALPIVVWLIGTRGSNKPWLVGIAAALMLLLPATGVFPFNYHRVAGLVMALILTPPGSVAHLSLFDSGPGSEEAIAARLLRR